MCACAIRLLRPLMTGLKSWSSETTVPSRPPSSLRATAVRLARRLSGTDESDDAAPMTPRHRCDIVDLSAMRRVCHRILFGIATDSVAETERPATDDKPNRDERSAPIHSLGNAFSADFSWRVSIGGLESTVPIKQCRGGELPASIFRLSRSRALRKQYVGARQ